MSQEEKNRIAEVIKERYHDFGPTFAHEKLVEKHGATCSHETVRQIMISEKNCEPNVRTIKQTHPCRQRRACVDKMSQLDGSPHHWFEDRAEDKI